MLPVQEYERLLRFNVNELQRFCDRATLRKRLALTRQRLPSASRMSEQARWELDTNVLVSRLLSPDGEAAKAVDHALAHGVLQVSEATLEELSRVLSRLELAAYVTIEDGRRFVELLGGVARIVPIVRVIHACLSRSEGRSIPVCRAGRRCDGHHQP